MSTDWAIPLGAAVVGGLFVLAGQQLTARNERRRSEAQFVRDVASERATWSRQRRTDAYQRIVVLHSGLLIERPEHFVGDDDLQSEVAARNTELVRKLMDALGVIQLFGTKTVIQLADEAGKEIIGKPGHLDPATLTPKWEALTKAMRSDLGVTDSLVEFVPRTVTGSELEPKGATFGLT